MLERKMSIAQCRQRIIETIACYRQRDELGQLCIPVASQRPIVLIGPPGVGKTYIMEDIAKELHLPLVSYSMTHHTRQSAQGLPSIVTRDFGGQPQLITEYTMSEIIATVFSMIEATGQKEGLLFLDEINCVSETLHPLMLQFLQYKTFGQHTLPEGWVVVTAGNPPEHNRSARPFDMATEDRLVRLEVDSDFDSWRKWAINNDVHPAILAYLNVKNDHFSTVQTMVDQVRFTTPRSWSDMSRKLHLCEQLKFTVDEFRIREFIKHPEIAKSFAQYYDLWLKSSKLFDAQKVLTDDNVEEIRRRAASAKFDERVALIHMLISAMLTNLTPIVEQHDTLEGMLKQLREIRRLSVLKDEHTAASARTVLQTLNAALQKSQTTHMISDHEAAVQRRCAVYMEKVIARASEEQDSDKAFWSLREMLKNDAAALGKEAAEIRRQMERLFSFIETAYNPQNGRGAELLMVVTELTNAANALRFIQLYGCDKYYKHSRSLMFTERQLALNDMIDQLDLDD